MFLKVVLEANLGAQKEVIIGFGPMINSYIISHNSTITDVCMYMYTEPTEEEEVEFTPFIER